jgi:3-oxoacyl-[acyl-carrier-protein] synthase-1
MSNMSRAVITGLGLVSSIGSSLDEAEDALRHGRSGLVQVPEMREVGISTRVFGQVKGWDPKKLNKRARLTMSLAAQYAGSAALDAVRDAGLDLDQTAPSRVAVLVGTGFGGINEVSRMHQLLISGRKSRAGATGVVKLMNSTASANIASMFGVQGRAYSASTNTATGADNIGQAFQLIQDGLADVVICGAAEEDSWRQLAPCLAAQGSLAQWDSDRPTEACRPYDTARSGTVMSAGAGILILEDLDHARRRRAQPYAEIVGYGAGCDGAPILQPNGVGLQLALTQVLDAAEGAGAGVPQYINANGDGTVAGDALECRIIRSLFGDGPLVSSTKGLSGHAVGAAGALEAVYSILMLSRGFVAHTMNLESVASECAGLRHVKAPLDRQLENAMSINLGLGGFSSVLLFRRF